MPDNVARLLKMAEAEFPDLTEPEREVVRCAASGEWANLTPMWPLPAKGTKRKPGGGPLRSAVVEWLCTNERAKQKVHRKGLQIGFATLDKQLDLRRANVPFFFSLHACRIPGLDTQGAQFSDNLNLKYCRIDGKLDIISSRIGGQFLCDGTLVHGRNGVSINADGADIGSGVVLSQGFRAVGEVRLLGAKIIGQFDCTGGIFLNRKGTALSADGAAIEYDVLLSEGFHAVGEVRLMGAKIQGQLNCNGGTFQNEAGYALNLQGAVISDAMFLEPKRLRGEVGLHGAEVTGTLRMLSDSTAKASLDLRSAKVGVLFDSRDSWPEASKLTLDGFEYGDIDQDSPRSAKERLEWLGRMPNGQFLPQPYEQLAKWFQKTGHDSEAKAIRIAKEEKRLENMSWEREPYQRVFWHLAGLLVDYGYRPQKITPYLLTLICTCAFIFWVGYPQSMTQSVSYQYAVQQENASLGHANATNYPTFNPIIYSIDVALPIVDLQQERYWMPDSESQFGATYWFVNWIEVLAGWVLTSFAIAGATGIIRKD